MDSQTIVANAILTQGRTVLRGTCDTVQVQVDESDEHVETDIRHSQRTYVTGQLWEAQEEHSIGPSPFKGLYGALEHQIQLGGDPHSGRGFLITCSAVPPDDDIACENAMDNGLLWLHEYGIIRVADLALDAHALGLTGKLIQISNPHGVENFTGEWGNTDPRMTPELKDILDPDIGAGNHWMSFDVFLNTFTRFDVAQMFVLCGPSSTPWFSVHRTGMLDSAMCGAGDHWFHNPRWLLNVRTRGEVAVSISQPGTKFINSADSYPVAIGLSIVADVLDTRYRRGMLFTELPPHRVIPGSGTLHQHADMKLADSPLAMILMKQACVNERQISVTIWLEPTMRLDGLDLPVNYYVVPEVLWPTEAEEWDYGRIRTLPVM